jgi:hypothetical protein
MPFPPARFQRTSLVYCASIAGVLLAAAIIVFGFHSAGSAMLAEAAFQQGRVSLPGLDQMEAPQNVQFTAGNLSRIRGE